MTWNQFSSANKSILALERNSVGTLKKRFTRKVKKDLDAYRRAHEKKIDAYKGLLQLYNRVYAVSFSSIVTSPLSSLDQ